MVQTKCVRCGKEYNVGCNAIAGLCPNCSSDTSYQSIKTRVLCFTSKEGRVALCQHDYLDNCEQGECETCLIKSQLEDYADKFFYFAWGKDIETRRKNTGEDFNEENLLKYSPNCEGFFTEHGCLFKECNMFLITGEDEWRYYGGCRLGYRGMGWSVPKIINSSHTNRRK